MTAKIPLTLSKMSLGQLQAFGGILDALMTNDDVDVYQFRANISMIAFNTPSLQSILSDRHLKQLFPTILEAAQSVVKDYNRTISSGKYKDFFSVPVYSDNLIKTTTRLFIDPDIGKLPAAFWAQLLAISKQLNSKKSYALEFESISKVLARVSWGKKEKIIVNNGYGGLQPNQLSVTDKETNLFTMNAKDAVEGYVFFLILHAIYSQTADSQFLTKRLVTQILKQVKKEYSSIKNGDGSGSLKRLLQTVTKLSSVPSL